jgi:hypothetical protein
VPAQFAGGLFLGGSVFNDLVVWVGPPGPSIPDSDARFHASLNTCNCCHGPESGTTFLMVNPRSVGSEASLSPFMTGTTVFDPLTGQPRTLNDLSRRKADLTGVVCAPAGMAPVATK